MQPSDEHLLALKVMRLTRPTLSSPLPVTCDNKDLPGNLLNESLQKDATAVQGTETISCGQFLLLPQNPVNIYLGETFSSLISVYSETTQPVQNITVKVDLQTSSQRLVLSSNPPTAVLEPDGNINVVIHYEVTEIGTHILVCEVTYNNAMGLPTSFRKFFKIQVMKPLDVKTKFYNAENDNVHLEAQVQNITAGPICLEKIELNASNLFQVTSLNKAEKGKSVFGRAPILQPNTICQFLYCLTPDQKLSTDLKMLSGATNVGNLDIIWRSNLGERGRLQTSQLQRMGSDYGAIRLSVVGLPSFVLIEEIFQFKCKVFNNCDRPVELMLFLEGSKEMTWSGLSGRTIPSIPPRCTEEILVEAIALLPGLQAINGIKLMDISTKKYHNFDAIGQVFVIIHGKGTNVKKV